MSQVWGLDLPDSEMLIMLALADWSNDEGQCWPSIAQLAKKTRKGERTIQGAIKSMAAAGHLTRNERSGKGCTYTLHPRSDCTPAAAAPRSPRTPAKSAPPQPLPPTPAAAADNTSGHIISPEASPPPNVRKRSEAKAKPFRLPSDWRPVRFPDGTVAREGADRRGKEWARAALESFRNWAANAADTAGAGRKLDWQAAWANWIIEQDKRDGRRDGNQHLARDGRSPSGGRGRTVDAALAFIDGG
jgi:hypothetical protein